MRRVRPSSDALYAAAAAALSLVGAVLVLRLWRADLSVPFEYYGDVNLQHLLLRGVLDRGWYFENPSLGAPNGLELYDYPVLNGDTLNVVFVWLLGLLGLGSAAAMNVLYLASYPLVGLTGFLALRRLGAAQGPALVCAVLYALLPFHFLRGEGHLFLATYYAVPAGAYLATAVLDGDRLRLATAIGLAVLVGTASGSFYYAAFTLVLVVLAAALRFVATRDRAALVAGGIVAGAVLAVSLVQLAPTIVYRVANGTNEEVAQRHTFESEVYSLKLTQLVLPIDGHRIDAVAKVKNGYSKKFPAGEANSATLGIVGTVGLAWLFAVVIGAVVGRRAPGRHTSLAALALLSFLLATVGGVGTLVGVVFPQIRAWNRLSVFIAFFALAAVALGLTALGERLRRPAPFAAVLGAVLVVGVFDQTTSAFVPQYDAVEAQWDVDAAFFSSLDSRFPKGTMVVQLPYEAFPEPAAARQAIYEPVKAYLHTHGLRWSYGAMRGRPEDWAAVHATKPAAELVPDARAAGFAAILVDRLGYGDDGAAIEAELRQVLGSEPERSPTTRYLFWRL
jgi:phosphoglycerol transferase